MFTSKTGFLGSKILKYFNWVNVIPNSKTNPETQKIKLLTAIIRSWLKWKPKICGFGSYFNITKEPKMQRNDSWQLGKANVLKAKLLSSSVQVSSVRFYVFEYIAKNCHEAFYIESLFSFVCLRMYKYSSFSNVQLINLCQTGIPKRFYVCLFKLKRLDRRRFGTAFYENK